jgi:hypothetical protein
LGDENAVESIEQNFPPLFTRGFRILARIGLVLLALFGLYVLGLEHSLREFSNLNASILLLVTVSALMPSLLLTFIPNLDIVSIVSSILTTSSFLGDLLVATVYKSAIPDFLVFTFLLLAFDAILITQFVIGIASFISTRRSGEAAAEDRETGKLKLRIDHLES